MTLGSIKKVMDGTKLVVVDTADNYEYTVLNYLGTVSEIREALRKIDRLKSRQVKYIGVDSTYKCVRVEI